MKVDDTIGKGAVLSILTMQGLTVYEGPYSKSSAVSTSDLRPGVYILVVVSNNGFKETKKWVFF